MRLYHSFLYALNGIRICIGKELNFSIQLIAAIVAVSLSIVLKISSLEWIWITFCIVLVLSLEMMNTVVEKIANLITKEHHPDIKKIKDIAAGAVLITAAGSVIIAIIIFMPKIINLLQS